MGKKKSAVYFVLITIVLAVLCAWCTVSFSVGIQNYHSVIGTIEKDPTLGGANVFTYYPEGVMSAEDMQLNLIGQPDDEKDDYLAKYIKHDTGSLYLEKEVVADEDTGKITEEWKTSFANDVKAIRERYEAFGALGTKVEVVDDYSVRVTLPDYLSDVDNIATYFSYMGGLTVDVDGSVAIKADDDYEITHYLSGASAQYANDTAYVSVSFTDAGRIAIAAATESASSSASNTINFKIGENSILSVSVTEQIDEPALYVSGSFTEESSRVVGILLNQAINGAQTDLAISEVGEIQTLASVNGANTMTFVYIVLGAFLLVSALFFFIRYHALGTAHLYGYLVYAVGMAMSLSFIPIIQLSVSGLIALLITSLTVCVSNAIAFEAAKREYALGKTMTTSVKTGYKKVFWGLFDMHIVLAIISLFIYAIAVTELQTFAFIFFLGTLFSGVCSLGLTRFFWSLTMTLWNKKAKFCNFKREEVEEDD